MTPEEKWARLTNPQTVADYGLSLSESELEAFKEGKVILAAIRDQRELVHKQEIIAERIGQNMVATIDKIIREILCEES